MFLHCNIRGVFFHRIYSQSPYIFEPKKYKTLFYSMSFANENIFQLYFSAVNLPFSMERKPFVEEYHLFFVSLFASVHNQWNHVNVKQIFTFVQHNSDRAVLDHNMDSPESLVGRWNVHQNDCPMVTLKPFYPWWTTISHVQCGIFRNVLMWIPFKTNALLNSFLHFTDSESPTDWYFAKRNYISILEFIILAKISHSLSIYFCTHI